MKILCLLLAWSLLKPTFGFFIGTSNRRGRSGHCMSTDYTCKIINRKIKVEKVITIPSDKLILDVVTDHMDIPYQCKGGICNSCVGLLVKGVVDQNSEQENILSAKALAKGYVLTCVAKPRSDIELFVDMELEYIKDPEIW